MIGKEKERGDLFMNKNLKRALNTTAAVSMSLAMVLGAVNPVSAALSDDGWKYEAVADSTAFGKKVVEALGDVTTIALDDVVYVEGVEGDNLTLEGLLKATVKTATTTDALTGETVSSVLDYSIEFGAEKYTDEEKAAVKHLIGLAEGGVDTLLGYENALKKWYDGDNAVTEDVLKLFENVEKALAYKGNVKTNQTGENTDQDKLANIETYFAELKEAVADYKDDNYDEYVKEFVEKFENETVFGTVKVKDLLDENTPVEYNRYTNVEAFIKKATKDSYKPEASDVKYGDVKEEDAVAELVEGLENVVAEMKEAKQIVEKDSKGVVKAYKDAIKEKVAELNAADDEEKLDSAIGKFRTAEIEAVRNYVEEFVNEFWTVAAVERTNGTYRTKWVDAGLGRYYAVEKFDSDIVELMKTLVDNEEETTNYDLLVGTTANVDKLIAAVTTDIEGITMESKLTNREAAKIIAAHKALIEIGKKADGKDAIYASLSYKEKKAVDANRDLIEVLYFKLILNGEITTVGWVETAKGWEYYDNNGNRVMEGWAPGNGYWSFMKNGYSVSNEWCAANDGWYYMGADGKMVTGKVVIDGVEQDFGTDGIWVR